MLLAALLSCRGLFACHREENLEGRFAGQGQAAAKEKGRWEHELRKPAGTFDMVPSVTLDPLSSTSKLVDAG